MAKQNRTTLKAYFNTGDIPAESNYVDLIDSNLNLSENNTGNINLTGNITASGEISASGDIITDVLNIGGPASTDKALYRAASDNALSIGFPIYDVDIYGTAVNIDSNVILPSPHTLDVGSHITASGNISASGTIISNVITPTTITNVDTTHITASGNISASGTLYGNEAYITGHITASGDISSSGNLTADNASFKDSITIRETSGNGLLFSNNNDKIYYDGNNILISIDDGEQYIFKNSGLNLIGNITASQTISASGNIFASSFSADDAGGFRFKSDNVRLLADTTGDNLLIYQGGLNTQGNITASGNISASDRVFATHLKLNQDGAGNGAGSSIYFGSTPTLGGRIYDDTNGFVMSYDDTDVLKVGENTIEITNTLKVYGSEGDVMIGANAEPGEKLEVVGNISASGKITSQTAVASFNYNLNHSANTATFAFGDGGYDLGGSFGRESVILTITGMPAKDADGVIGELIFLNRVIPYGTVILTTTNSNVVAIPFGQTSTQFKLGFKASPTRNFDGGNVVVSITYLMPD